MFHTEFLLYLPLTMDISAHAIFLQNKASTVDRPRHPVILNSRKFSSSVCAVKRSYIAMLTSRNTQNCAAAFADELRSEYC
jgi:hypothetical protein